MNDVIVIEKKNALQLFTEPDALHPLLKQIEFEALAAVPDVGSMKGRKEIASIAYKVSQAKTYIDGIGKDLVAEMKEMPKKVDASRKQARDFLDDLKDKVRQPLDAWEAKQAEIEAAEKAAEEAAALAEQVERDHELALLMNREFDHQKEAKRLAAEKEQREREERIAKEAAERAVREAEERARADKEAGQRAIIEAELKARQAQEAADAVRRKAEADSKEAAERAEREKQQAIEAERRRLASEAEAKQREDAIRAANVENRRVKNGQAVAGLMEFAGLNEEQAKSVLIAIAKDQIRNVRMTY